MNYEFLECKDTKKGQKNEMKIFLIRKITIRLYNKFFTIFAVEL